MPRKGRLRKPNSKRKRKRKNRSSSSSVSTPLPSSSSTTASAEDVKDGLLVVDDGVSVKSEDVQKPEDAVEIEWVSASLADIPEDMQGVFSAFLPAETLTLSKKEFEKRERLKANGVSKEESEGEDAAAHGSDDGDRDDVDDDDDDDHDDDDDEGPKLSRRAMKRQKRLSVAVLKQLVARPEVVEVWDVTSADPALLVALKSHRGTVPVPKHWCQKRKYLQGKRGIEKPPFELPEFITNTGISRVRQTAADADSEKSSKQKQRERTAPKMGRLDIDYKVLRDAFFKFQTKPKLSAFGDMYYEAKEYEVQMTQKKPGLLSDKLKEALGMMEGAPPPWLVNMQRYGPPPSYPKLKIPGLNAPLPAGAQFGYHPGGWGEPPVDQYGRPLYGDVFGTAGDDAEAPAGAALEAIRKAWGELDDESSSEESSSDDESESSDDESESSDDEEDSSEEDAYDASGIATPAGIVTPSGYETPDHIEVRKNAPKQLYQVLQREEVRAGSGAFVSTHGYVVPGSKDKSSAKKPKDAVGLIKSQKTKEFEVTLTPAEMANLADSSFLEQKMESALQAQSAYPQEAGEKRKKKDKKKDWKDFRF